MADDQKTEAIKYWKVQADGLADLGMFYQCSLPSMSLTTQDFKVWDDQAKPNPLPVGVQATFGDVTLSRGVDTQGELYNWISKIAQKGATPGHGQGRHADRVRRRGQPGADVAAEDGLPVVLPGLRAWRPAGTDVLTESSRSTTRRRSSTARAA